MLANTTRAHVRAMCQWLHGLMLNANWKGLLRRLTHLQDHEALQVSWPRATKLWHMAILSGWHIRAWSSSMSMLRLATVPVPCWNRTNETTIRLIRALWELIS